MGTPDQRYDLVVIGSGPAGEKGAAQAAYFGKKVALIEKADLVGGTCVHWGTIPSKCLRESAQHLSGITTRGIAGIAGRGSQQGVRIDQLIAHKQAVCAAETQRILDNLARHDVDLIHGRAELADGHTVLVHGRNGSTRRLSTDFVLIATGTHPFRPKTMDFDHPSIWDSDEILGLDRVPGSLLVYGAGVIGSEYASMFAALGAKVTLIEPRQAVLPFLDDDIRDRLLEAFTDMGIDIRLDTRIERAVTNPAGRVTAHLEGGGTLGASKLLFAAGRTGNSAGLGLEPLGIAVDKRGLIQVDQNYRTACDSVYAAGDIIGFPALASTGMEQARIAMCHAFGLTYKTKLATHLPYGIYTIPEVSMAGLTEQALREQGEPYETGTALYRDNPRGKIVGHHDGLLKLTFRREDRKLLGVHILGENAAELVHVGLTVLQFGGTIDTFIDACYNYPTLSDCYKYAAYDGLGRLAKATKPTS